MGDDGDSYLGYSVKQRVCVTYTKLYCDVCHFEFVIKTSSLLRDVYRYHACSALAPGTRALRIEFQIPTTTKARSLEYFPAPYCPRIKRQ